MSIKDTFDFFWKDKWIFTHLWEKKENNRTTGDRESRSKAETSIFLGISRSVQRSLSWAKWFPPPARHRSASVHPASLHSSPATSAASALQLQHQQRMAAAKTEMILPALQISEPLNFPHSPMDNYPKLEEVMMLSSTGTPFLTASAPEGAGFGSGEPGEQYDHLAGGKICLFFFCLWFSVLHVKMNLRSDLLSYTKPRKELRKINSCVTSIIIYVFLCIINSHYQLLI